MGITLGGSQLIAGLRAAKDGQINWDGRGTSVSVGAPLGILNSAGFAYVTAVSEPFAGKETFGRWLILSAGRSIAFDPFTFVSSNVTSLLPRGTRYAANSSVVSAPISITSPAVFGARPLVLGGGFLQIEANAIAPALPGLSIQAYTMGYGIVRSDQTFGLFNNPIQTFGYASPGVSAEVGFSIPLPSRQPRPDQRTPDV
ncbi:MAG: hypothetical protein F6J95_026790 [Leptolyngbya sp. SIO1E4]|nr:hypothetical protein [Leptolyngbya sp. SIO1E4]